MKKVYLLISLLALIGLTMLAGGRKKEAPSPAAPETDPQAPTQMQETFSSEDDTVLKFDYEPGSMGIYVKADPNIEAGPEVLDGITMTLSDGEKEVRRSRVSDRQFDIVNHGHQVGGFLLLDIPREMLEKAPNSWDDFKAAVDHIAKQVMPEVYPSKAHIGGGGGPFLNYELPVYMSFSIEADDGAQYYHMIYIGETYIYDFWHDTCWLLDGGGTMRQTLSAKDIKPELNQHADWTIHDFPDNPWASQG